MDFLIGDGFNLQLIYQLSEVLCTSVRDDIFIDKLCYELRKKFTKPKEHILLRNWTLLC